MLTWLNGLWRKLTGLSRKFSGWLHKETATHTYHRSNLHGRHR